MKIKEINIGSIGGIHYEMYEPDPRNLDIQQPLEHYEGRTDFLNLNGLFWTKLLSEEQIEKLIDVFLACYQEMDASVPYEQIIFHNPELFKNMVQEAKGRLCEQGLSERAYFGSLETLGIVCKLYSKLYFAPFELTVHEGFLLDSYSSLEMLKDCLVPAKNPYYWFLKRYIWEALLREQPECVWINGRMTVANMAVAKFLKNNIDNIKIFWALPGSEYYATNKIEDYLLYNMPLFSAIDGIVLDDFENTRTHIVQTLEQGRRLNEVYNLMYAERNAEGDVKIRRNPYKKYERESATAIETFGRVKRDEYQYRIAPWEVVNVKLFPQEICSWNKCAFCGINKKYRVLGKEKEFDEKIKELFELYKAGCRYFWFIDEEISAEHMRQLAHAVIETHMEIKWQIRARISKEFTDRALCRLLAKAGLKEIRFGLESASYRVLKVMNKFDDSFSLELAEQIVEVFHEEGVSVHFPVIIGFPGETDMEREQTYQFLRYLKTKYRSFTFNVNVLGLDVSSLLFKNWQHYGITRISFPCNPHYFLGNLVSWDCAETPFQEERLKLERDDFMRQQLYSWMPEDALVSPHIFYRLMETVRNTLTVKDGADSSKEPLSLNTWVKWNPMVIVYSKLCYNINDHQKIVSSIDIEKIQRIFKDLITVEEAIIRLKDCMVGYTFEDAKKFIIHIYYNDFLIKEDAASEENQKDLEFPQTVIKK